MRVPPVISVDPDEVYSLKTAQTGVCSDSPHYGLQEAGKRSNSDTWKSTTLTS